ncbi:FAD-dependent oxidoreductase [Rhizobiaceae bacterium n13]|uniref:FAD-dependent oxidoreductase n=1 Tax=Ferirhizobium litorale TaxID=2927786 RepID=A0AAE3U4X6_9HYPH|nr:FAD-dependent oxidoreductase [Fererhizobium litorale]MDI7862624.1 FAD-dependent oxidoreductase [Fererhizobium litorale]MDI7923893.1 FAD-dependent oxidoreductase [Fererhizobium litorale]
MRFDGDFHRTTEERKVAVIGSGISGLAAAWLLAKSMNVTIYEADSRLGGHANTVMAPSRAGPVPVDTGFIVYNDKNYPNLVALFDHLDVPTQASDMSFSASLDGGAFEYSGSGIRGLLGQRTNAIRPRFWRMISEILRFYREAPALLGRQELATVRLGAYLDNSGYSASFVEDHLLPMGAAIWSTTARDIRAYPLHAFIRFFDSHGLLALSNRPQWRTVTGGSEQYVSRLLKDYCGGVRLKAAVREVRRQAGGVLVTDAQGHRDSFSDVVIATHADHALAMLPDADERERSLLGTFRYTDNTAVLHSDTRLMPRRRHVWSSWNYIGERADENHRPLCVTYWMNRLQGIDPSSPLFVTLNPNHKIAREHLIQTFHCTHPLFDLAAMEAQKQLWQLQGRGGIWFCGAYFGSGFHEDGLQSGLEVAESLGGLQRPWVIDNMSSRIHTAPKLAAME